MPADVDPLPSAGPYWSGAIGLRTADMRAGALLSVSSGRLRVDLSPVAQRAIGKAAFDHSDRALSVFNARLWPLATLSLLLVDGPWTALASVPFFRRQALLRGLAIAGFEVRATTTWLGIEQRAFLRRPLA